MVWIFLSVVAWLSSIFSYPKAISISNLGEEFICVLELEETELTMALSMMYLSKARMIILVYCVV
jgi:hypothetical protein